MTPEAEELLLIPNDQIDYPTLAAGTLFDLATQRMEPFLATSALGELAIRADPAFPRAAVSILDAPWDKYLTAYALTALLAKDPEAGVRYTVAMLDSAEPVILEALVDNMLTEPTLFTPELRRALARRVRALPSDAFSDIDAIATFLEV